MNDYDKLRQFFDEMGVIYWMFDNVGRTHRYDEEPVESIFLLAVSQTSFCFDKDKRYLGNASDGSGAFQPRAE